MEKILHKTVCKGEVKIHCARKQQPFGALRYKAALLFHVPCPVNIVTVTVIYQQFQFLPLHYNFHKRRKKYKMAHRVACVYVGHEFRTQQIWKRGYQRSFHVKTTIILMPDIHSGHIQSLKHVALTRTIQHLKIQKQFQQNYVQPVSDLPVQKASLAGKPSILRS